MAILRFHLPVAIALAAIAYSGALALDARDVPPAAVCAASLSLRLFPQALLLEELRRCAAKAPQAHP
ncbi:MAG TPA: hypothetical protein VIV54_17025 [Burkholderiales bacterium]